jgi:predicted RNA-binding protein with TRAM domain
MNTTPPVHVGDVLTLKITGQGAKGDGMARHQKYVIFVPETEIDKTYTVRITKTLEKCGFGEVTG